MERCLCQITGLLYPDQDSCSICGGSGIKPLLTPERIIEKSKARIQELSGIINRMEGQRSRAKSEKRRSVLRDEIRYLDSQIKESMKALEEAGGREEDIWDETL